VQLSTLEKNIINESIRLKPQNRYLVVEKIIESLNNPDESINKLWVEESQKRLQKYKQGTLETMDYNQVFTK
jgi:hypothetical protein